METEPSSAAGDFPRWVLLDRYTGCHQGPSTSTADACTLARCVNSTGRPVQAYFRLVAPPAVSTLHVDVDEAEKNDRTDAFVLAAHGDSVLIHLTPHCQSYQPPDLLVYNAGDGAARPSSLSLLPPCGTIICHAKTGILRLGGGGGDGGFVVASLEITCSDNLAGSFQVKRTRLRMLRSGRWEWELTGDLPVRHTDGQEMKLSPYWSARTVIPVGDRFLYWIDQSRGIIFSDLTAESPELTYVPLPADPLLPDPDRDRDRRDVFRYASRSVCVTGGGSVVKFVRVSPRCCSTCPRYQHAFTISTWTLRTDDMAWEEDGVVDSNELSVLPRVPLEFPIISLDDPDVICFMSRESRHHPCSHGDKTAWFLTVDTRRKTLQWVCGYPADEEGPHRWNRALIPGEVSSYFNSCRRSGGDNHSSASHEDMGVSTAETRDEEREISAEIEEIPDMARDEMLKAHKILAGDDRRMRFLAALPADMRKEYCMLMTEVAASSAVVTASGAVRQLSP